MSAAPTTILVERRDRVGIVTLNRPEVLNALNTTVMREVTAAVAAFDADNGIGCILITGSERAFAAGADIAEMAPLSWSDVDAADFFAGWDVLARTRTPLVAAVAGFALGGGCELAMLCDVLIAGEGARFGQPEIKLGVIPGIGGSQRLTKLVGRSKAMDLCLTGRMMGAEEAERAGLVSRVVPGDRVLTEAMEVAATIAEMSAPAARLVKEAVNRADESSLAEGLRFERAAFRSTFATEDQKEGMAAFLEKRKPTFRHR